MRTEYDRIPFWKWGLSLVAGFVLTLFAYGLVGGIGGLSNIIPVKIGLLAMSGVGLLALYSGWCRLTEGRWPSGLAIRKAPWDTVLGLGIGAAYFCVIAAILALPGFYRITSVNNCWTDLLISFAYCFMVACGEEVIFRGILFRMIDERFNTAAALLVSGLLFGLMHLLNPGATLWGAVAIAVEAGFLLGAAYKCSDGLWLPIGIHWAWNFTEGNIFGFNVSGTPESVRLFVPEISGPDLLTGGRFGPEASIVAVLLGIALTIVFLKTGRKSTL